MTDETIGKLFKPIHDNPALAGSPYADALAKLDDPRQRLAAEWLDHAQSR